MRSPTIKSKPLGPIVGLSDRWLFGIDAEFPQNGIIGKLLAPTFG
jgi:hypothetical protein